MDLEQSKDGLLYADVPVKGIGTFYSRWGDLLGWASLLAALFFFAYVLLQKRFVNKGPS
jgi:apolipoprotein N-acyltransferase